MVAFGLVVTKLYKKNLAYRDLEQGGHYASPSYFVCDVHTCCKTFVIAKVSFIRVEDFGCLKPWDLVKIHN
jgi:hypothetical protein